MFYIYTYLQYLLFIFSTAVRNIELGFKKFINFLKIIKAINHIIHIILYSVINIILRITLLSSTFFNNTI